jgi:mono/diheme cytochrome c family protein
MKTTLPITVISLASIVLCSFLQGDELKASIERGKSVYESNCMSCHMDKGQGIVGAFPPLANTGRLSDKGKLVKIVLEGASDPITVNGTEYNMEMNPVALTDEQVSDVLNYIRNSWGNKGPMIKVEEVKKLKEEK